MKLHQKGFSTLEGTLILVVLIILIFGGYFVYSSRNNNDSVVIQSDTSSSNSKTSSTQDDRSASNSGTTSTVTKTEYIVVEDNQSYLKIKQWGVKIPIDGSIETVVYLGGNYNIGGGSSPDDAMLGLLSLGSSCSDLADSSKAPLGWYVRFTQDDVNRENVAQVTSGYTTLHDLIKTAVIIPGTDGGVGPYHYAYAKPISDCSNGENTATINAASSAFEQALKSIKSDE